LLGWIPLSGQCYDGRKEGIQRKEPAGLNKDILKPEAPGTGHFPPQKKRRWNAKRAQLVSGIEHANTARHVKIKADANPHDPKWAQYFESRWGKKMLKSSRGRSFKALSGLAKARSPVSNMSKAHHKAHALGCSLLREKS
jgi:hypothetical protein